MASYAARLRAHVRVPLYWNAYLLMVGGVASSVLGFAFWAVATRLYPPPVVGLSTAAVAALMFLTGMAGLFLDATLYRFLPAAGALSARLVAWTFGATVAAAIVTTSIFLVGLDVWARALSFADSSTWVVLACVGAVVASCLFVLEDGALLGLRRPGWIPIKSTAYGVAKIVLLVAFAGLLPTYGILAAWVVPLAFVVVLFGYFLARRVLPRHRDVGRAERRGLSARSVIGYAAGNYVGFLFMLAYRNLPPLLVIHSAGPRASAFFYPPWLIVSSLLALVTANLSVALVVEGAAERRQLSLHITRAVRQAARLLLPVAAVLLVAAPYVLRIFGSDYADEGAGLLRLLALSLIPSSICVLAFGVARVQDRVGAIVVNQMLLAVLVLGLSALLVPALGILGVGVAWLVAQTTVALILFSTQLRPALCRTIDPLALAEQIAADDSETRTGG